MIIIGLDPGSVRLGYGVIRIDGQRLNYIAAGVLSAPEGWHKYRRISEIGRDLVGVLEEYKPVSAAIEAGFIKGGQMGALVSGAARGVAAYLCVSRGIPVAEYAPSTVKKAAAGKGNATKETVGRVVQLRLGLRNLPPEDATDALACAITHAASDSTRRRMVG